MIVNSSPLIIFGKINRLDLLIKVLKKIIISEEVYKEVVVKGVEVNAPEAILIKKYIDNKKIHIKSLESKWKKRLDLLKSVNISLDEGEAETIVLALQEKEKIVIIDEKIARQVAELNNLLPIGSLGVLLFAFRKKIIDEKEAGIIINDMLKYKFRMGANVISEFWTILSTIKRNKS